MGAEEQRLEALRLTASGSRATQASRIEFGRSLARAGKLEQSVAVLSPLTAEQPELRLDLLSILIRKASRIPGDARVWREVERRWTEAEKTLPRRPSR